MKTLFLLLLAAASVAATPAPPAGLAATIRAAKWKQRVLLVVAPTADNADFQQQKKLLAAAPAGLAERELLVLDVLPGQLAPADKAFLHQQLGLKLQGFEVVLIGKDGGVKERGTQTITPQALFGTIDRMPMRRQEMQQRR